ncbi:aspartate/tyrosine/aromatic aminotransferase [Halogeometricum pallidum JCM 14848]|uniref:Aminotransferase n=1 Tax=Halogeometricum pallidum JCM 14848 TaxID=1227487 RepID=M0DG06_HALPD|nr:pyridoxal phosphate-dependent aminotransferase [Halogeometricum pallidum]ELZ34431.1 aspartate/tyrosine/aromatic aminotransferase [Halogeometricum pallidum JCM 14848]
MFPPLPYLEWISGRPEEATYDLGSSDLRTSAHQSGVIPDSLVDLPDPDEEVTLRSQLADEYGVDEENVLVTAGATHANLVAESAAISVAESEAGDATPPQVLVEKPGYQPLVSTPGALGARVDRFIRPEEGDELSADRIAAAARSSFALAVTSNRHNPTGRLTTRERLSKAADAVNGAGGYLLVDEVYGPFVTDETTDGAFGGVTAAGLDGAVVTGSLTKFYGLGGLRIGWLIGSEEILDAARDAAFHLPTVAEPSRALARRALHNREELSATAREHLRANHELLAEFAAAHEKLSGEVYDGSSYAFLEHEDADGDDVAEAAWEEGILVVPGRFFDDADGFRVALGREPEHVEAALDALSDVLASLSADA